MQNEVRYPIGIQDFEKIRREGRLYVDKTAYVYKLTHDLSCVFLSRPRRFGKSLLVSTLKAYFEGRKDLFAGLAIEKLETEWTQHPVLLFSLATGKLETKDEILLELNSKLARYEEVYGRNEADVLPGQRLQGLIERAYRQTGREVVVLIDEYDAPLLHAMHDQEKLEVVRGVMSNFYSPLKDCGYMMKFLFLTGITKFSHLSIFSELNNLKNISMLPKYAGICGITEEELNSNLANEVECMAEENGWTREQAFLKLKDNYDGYHFSRLSPDVYNPFSLLNALDDKMIGAYWYASTPSFLVEVLRLSNLLPSQLGGNHTCVAEQFDAPVGSMDSVIPLLYQSGYFTIKDYDGETELYTLGFPNREIRIGLIQGLLPYIVGETWGEGSVTVREMIAALRAGDVDGMLAHLQKYLGTIPYTDNMGKPEVYEGHWQQMLWSILSLMGASVDVEVRTPFGRVDLVARTARRLYLFELKLNESAEAAMNQIDLKDYPSRFALCGLPVTKVAVNFSMEKRNIEGWKVEEDNIL